MFEMKILKSLSLALPAYDSGTGIFTPALVRVMNQLFDSDFQIVLVTPSGRYHYRHYPSSLLGLYASHQWDGCQDMLLIVQVLAA
jgi:hypothetical protein